MALCLFSYLGVETAAVAAAKVKDPDRNVPRATIFGTLATAVVYLLSLTAVFGIVPSTQLGIDGAVLDRRQRHLRRHLGRLRDGRAGRDLGIRCAERLDDDLRRDAAGASKDGLFPDQFGRLSSRGVPVFGIVASGAGVDCHGAVLCGYHRLHRVQHVGLHVRHHRAIPYAFSALAQIIKWRVRDNRPVHTPRFAATSPSP